MLLLPSTLQCDPQNKLYSSANCNFPAVDISLSKLILSGIISLYPTGMCYRRLFVADHIPEKLWLKLVPRFLSSAKVFYNIILNNCVKGITLKKMADVSEAVIGDHQCKCWYWKNGVTLIIGGKVLFCINGLMKCGNTSDDAHRYSQSVTTEKIKTMQLVDEGTLNLLFPKNGDGIEVNVPDYVLQSSLHGKTHASSNLSPQILSQILEFINELCVSLFDGNFDKGIYSQCYINQVVICPFCYGDSHVPVADYPSGEAMETSLRSVYGKCIAGVNCVTKQVGIPGKAGCYGFDIQICILEAQKHGFVCCRNHGKLNLHHLTPDLVSKRFVSYTVAHCSYIVVYHIYLVKHCGNYFLSGNDYCSNYSNTITT